MQACLLTLLLIALQVGIGLCIGIAYKGKLAPALATAFGNVICFTIVLSIGLVSGSLEPARAFPFRGVRIGLFFPMILTSLGLFVVLSDLDNLVAWLLPPPRFIVEFFSDLFGGAKDFWMSLVLVTVIAPLTEELMFRGLFLSGLLRQHRAWVAITITAMLFAFVHLNPWQFPVAMILGLLFGWWFLRTQSLWPCLLGHALHNGLPSLLRLFPNSKIPGFMDTPSNIIVFQPWWFDLSGLTLAVIGIAWTRLLFGRMRTATVAQEAAMNRVEVSSLQAPSTAIEEPRFLQTSVAEPELQEPPVWRAIDLRTQDESRLHPATFELDQPIPDASK
jgi:membrane protease YdiL (CAAX protease family)